MTNRYLAKRLMRWIWSSILAWCLVVALGCRPSVTSFDLQNANYVGSQACIQCHAEEYKKWSGSHHDLAMQVATDSTVRGDFNNRQLEHHGVVSRMFRDGKRFMVHTEGPDGTLRDFEVKYVFGVEPLQQYMVEFPGEDAGKSIDTGSPTSAQGAKLPRIQVLRISWNTEARSWFHLDPPDVREKLAPDDDLHWTGIAQRWNNMCAECHSTNYQKSFVPEKEMAAAGSSAANAKAGNGAPSAGGQYHSTFSEINVSCEACHGPGSLHIALARQWFPGWNRQRGYGLANLKLTAENQIQACAPCHSRRDIVQAGFRPGDNFYDHYSNQLLLEPIYYPDGQIWDEDYVHGSFIQSKMYHKGIRCTDCHDPHTSKLKHDGNQVCTSCHQHPAAKYDSVAHHFHKPGTAGAQCVSCHMPTTTYMSVHARHDHSLRIPRPDLSLSIDTPNACTGCHLKLENVAEAKRPGLRLYQDWMQKAREGDVEVKAEIERANRYCDQACDRWYGKDRRRDEHFGTALAAGQRGDMQAEGGLRKILRGRGYEAPAIARATALQVLAQLSPKAAAEEALRSIEDDHPLVRSVAAGTLVLNTTGTDTQRSASVNALERALADKVRCVRTEAARILIEFPRNLISSNSSARLQAVLDELEQGLQYNNDRAGAHLSLGMLAELQGRSQAAMEHYRNAIRVEPRATGPRSNLAALLSRTLEIQSNLPPSTVEAISAQVDRLRKEELPLLARDVGLLPSAPAIRHRYGLALYLDGQKELAAEHLLKAATLEPTNAQFAQTAALVLESLQRWDEAIDWAKTTLQLTSQAPENQLLLQRIIEGKSKSAQSQAP